MDLLSHFITKTSPTYGNKPSIKIESSGCIAQGDSCNSMNITINNHVGTHIDLPRHFDPNGKVLASYPNIFWKCISPQIIDLPVPPNHIIEINEFKSLLRPDVDFLILRTGFEAVRDTEAYWKNNPGVSPMVGRYLRLNFPTIKFIGFDFISLSSFQNRELGRVAHREFLIQDEERQSEPICIVEDMKISHIDKNSLGTILICPLLIAEADGVPVTIFSNLGS